MPLCRVRRRRRSHRDRLHAIGSAHLNDIDPLAYVTDVITKLQAGWPMARIDELLPDVWANTVAPS